MSPPSTLPSRQAPPSPRRRVPARLRRAMAAVDAIVQKAGSKEVKERLAAIDDAAAYVASVRVGTDDAPALIDALVPGLSDNNVKVAQGGLGVLLSIVTQLEEDCAPFLGGLWSPLIEKMGDAKGPIRERAVDLAMAVATLALPPAQVFERLKPAFCHKNWRARESALLCLGRVLATSEGTVAGLPLKVTLPMVLKLVEDGQPAVREACTLALEQLHRHVGDMLLGELQRREIRPSILKVRGSRVVVVGRRRHRRRRRRRRRHHQHHQHSRLPRSTQPILPSPRHCSRACSSSRARPGPILGRRGRRARARRRPQAPAAARRRSSRRRRRNSGASLARLRAQHPLARRRASGAIARVAREAARRR
jgi:hypothetical protein